MAIMKPVLNRPVGQATDEVDIIEGVKINMNQLIFDVGIEKKLADMSGIHSSKTITPLGKNDMMIKGSQN